MPLGTQHWPEEHSRKTSFTCLFNMGMLGMVVRAGKPLPSESPYAGGESQTIHE